MNEELKKPYAKMSRICSMKECCSFDIRQKLQRTGLSEKEVSQIISQLQKNRYIDDARYAQSFINDKLRFNKWGKNKIILALVQKRIDKKIIEEAFSELPGNLLQAELKPLLEKKAQTIKANSAYEKRNKLIRFALGRGFEMSDILEYMDKISLE